MGYAERRAGTERNGLVLQRDFDLGVVETLGAEEVELEDGSRNWFLTGDKIEWPPVNGFVTPPGLPGIPINFSYPEDLTDDFVLPIIVVVFEDLSPAMNRWHPGTLQYRVPATGANPVSVVVGNRTFSGYDRMEEKQQAIPYDFNYTINIHAYRRWQINPILTYVLGIYQPYTRLLVRDSEGDRRIYSAYNESVSVLDDVFDLTQRVLGFSISLRVEGEMDTISAQEFVQVTGPANLTTRKL